MVPVLVVNVTLWLFAVVLLFFFFFFFFQFLLCSLSYFCVNPVKRQENLHLKMPSVYVVCWIFLLTFQTYFCMQANSVDPDQTAPRGAVWPGSTLFAKRIFLNHKQMTKQTTIVVTWQLCCEKVSLIIPKNAQIQIHSAHEQSLIRAFGLLLSIHTFFSANDSVSGQQSPWSECANAQANLGARWQHMSDDTFSHGSVHYYDVQARKRPLYRIGTT